MTAQKVEMIALSIEYVAGLFDGEGWVRVQTPGMNTKGEWVSGNRRLYPSYQVVAGIAMTHKPLMLAMYQQFGGTLHGDDHYRRKDPNNRTIYRWHTTSLRAEEFLAAIVGLSICKREQIELALQLQAHIREHRLVMRWADDHFKTEVAAHRKSLADQITLLKKVNYNLPVDHGAKTPYRF